MIQGESSRSRNALQERVPEQEDSPGEGFQTEPSPPSELHDDAVDVWLRGLQRPVLGGARVIVTIINIIITIIIIIIVMISSVVVITISTLFHKYCSTLY